MSEDKFVSMVQIFEDIFNNVKIPCPVCKKELTFQNEVLAYRIRKNQTNISLYGIRTILHPLNTIYVCSLSCAERVSLSWEGPKAYDKKVLLLKEIVEDIKKFVEGFKDK